MSSTRILRFVVVLAVAAGLAVGPVGAAVAAPERGDGERAGWGVELGEWVEAFWAWLVDDRELTEQPAPLAPTASGTCECTGEECADARGSLDPNG